MRKIGSYSFNAVNKVCNAITNVLLRWLADIVNQDHVDDGVGRTRTHIRQQSLHDLA